MSFAVRRTIDLDLHIRHRTPEMTIVTITSQQDWDLLLASEKDTVFQVRSEAAPSHFRLSENLISHDAPCESCVST